MKFTDIITINPGQVISFVGCGGKTSAIEGIITELEEEKVPVLHTTTTKIWLPEKENRKIVVSDELEMIKKEICRAKFGTVTIGYALNGMGKLTGIPYHWIDEIHRSFPQYCILVEADGCKGKSIKVYGDHEPCIPPQTEIVVILVGLDAFREGRIQRIVHRPEEFSQYFQGERPTVEERILSMFSLKGLVSGVVHKGEKYIFLNKVSHEELSFGKSIAQRIMMHGKGQLTGVILGDTYSSDICKEVAR